MFSTYGGSSRSFRWWLTVACWIGFAFCIMIGLYSMTSSTQGLSMGRLMHVIDMFSPSKDDVYTERSRTLAQACDGKAVEYRGSKDVMHGHLFIDHKHSLVYCPIAKVASTFWKRVIQVASGVKTGQSPFDVRKAHDGSLVSLRSLDFDVSHWILKNYTTFLFVREPYSRLLACYIDKFYTTNPLYWRIGKTMIKNYRGNPTNLSLSCGHDATFPEFIKHVIHTLETGSGIDQHWAPMYDWCRPCQIQYDFIGKLETISKDTDYMLGKFHMQDDVIFDDMENDSEIDRLVANTAGLFKRMTPEAERCMSMSEALHRLVRKEQVRGILSKNIDVPIVLRQNSNVSPEDVENFILEAHRQSGDREIRKQNRNEAFLEAYRNIPEEDMIKLQTIYYPDFVIFGYDPRPKELFEENKSLRKKNKFYFP